MEIKTPIPLTVNDAIEELCVKFLNLPVGEETTVERIFFHLQQAHWFYVDEWADPEGGDCSDEDATSIYGRNKRIFLPYLRFDAFSKLMFSTSPMLREYREKHGDFKARFKAYSNTIPRYGAVMLNASCDHLLLIQSYLLQLHKLILTVLWLHKC